MEAAFPSGQNIERKKHPVNKFSNLRKFIFFICLDSASYVKVIQTIKMLLKRSRTKFNSDRCYKWRKRHQCITQRGCYDNHVAITFSQCCKNLLISYTQRFFFITFLQKTQYYYTNKNSTKARILKFKKIQPFAFFPFL